MPFCSFESTLTAVAFPTAHRFYEENKQHCYQIGVSWLLCNQCLLPQAVSKSQFKTKSKTCQPAFCLCGYSIQQISLREARTLFSPLTFPDLCLKPGFKRFHTEAQILGKSAKSDSIFGEPCPWVDFKFKRVYRAGSGRNYLCLLRTM